MEKKKFRFNIVDGIIVLVLIAAIGIVGVKFLGGNKQKDANTSFRVSFFCEEVPSYAAELIVEGDVVTDDDKKVELGTVEAVTLGPSRTYAATAEGEMKLAPKEGANNVEVVAQVTAKSFEHGITLGAGRYGVGHSLTLRVGQTKIYGRVSGIEKIAE